LSKLPPATLPLTALAGPSLALQDESAVAGLPSARLVPVAPPGIALRVYQASVLHSDWPLSDVNGRGERTYTTRPVCRPLMASVTLRRSAETVAEPTVRVCSSTFGPP
jgi:hypothetical protein